MTPPPGYSEGPPRYFVPILQPWPQWGAACPSGWQEREADDLPPDGRVEMEEDQ